MPDTHCDKCGAYWECEHKHTPAPFFNGSKPGDVVIINGKEYEAPKLLRGTLKPAPKRFTAAQVDANKEERRERNRQQAEELTARFRKSDQ